MQVFISHVSSDATLAREIAELLREQGLEAWVAGEHILPGDNWAAAVSEGLQESQAMVALFNPKSAAQSSQVQSDVSYAMSRIAYRDRIVPLVVGSRSELPDNAIPWSLGNRQVVEMADRDELRHAAQQVVAALKLVGAR